MIKKVISGGQRGADIAGLRAAAGFGIETGGWMPKGFKTLDGNFPEFAFMYNMQELDQPGYKPRTYKNVKESDITLRFARNFNTYGEQCTGNAISKYGKECYDIIMHEDEMGWEMIPTHDALAEQIKEYSPEAQVINIAGNAYRQMEEAVESYVRQLLEDLND